MGLPYFPYYFFAVAAFCREDALLGTALADKSNVW
jgi:hypothetical protein